ncbi:MAG: hypothetical protein K0Q95_445 [Bacteroidota bacterium]|nr:hypothetical protein [Bacteroidota bacterium]
MTSRLLEPSPENTVITSREVKAAIEKAFRSWTDPEYLAKWWGPKGFTNTFHTHDLRPGGKWSFIMHGPDKRDYQNDCEFIKIEKPTFVAWDHLSKPVFQVQTSFEKITNEKTKVIFRMIFQNAEECNSLRAFIEEKNEENFDKLDQVLESMPS